MSKSFPVFAVDSKHYRILPGKRTTVEIRAGSSPAFAPLVLLRPSEKVQLSLKNQCLQRFLRPESSEVVR